MRVAVTYNIKKENPDSSCQDSQVLSQIHDEELKKILTNGFTENYSHRLSDKYAEWDEMETIEAVKSAIEKNRHEVVLIEANENAYDTLRVERPDIVFNIAEGFGGAARESYMPAILEMLNIPYTASDPITIGICHDKSRCKEILSAYSVPTPKYYVSNKEILRYAQNDTEGKEILKRVQNDKWLVKPLHEGSSKGIYNSSVVNTIDELNAEIVRVKKHYNQPALVEQYLDGREFTVALLGNDDNVEVLPIIEINLDCIPQGYNKIFSYEVKWYFDTRENKLDIFTCPAKISKKLKNRIEEICLRAYKVLRIRDWARMDVRCDGLENPYIIEVNPLPGILPNPDDNSCFPKAAREAGIGYDEMINMVLEMAMERQGLKPHAGRTMRTPSINAGVTEDSQDGQISDASRKGLKKSTKSQAEDLRLRGSQANSQAKDLRLHLVPPTKPTNFEQKA